MHLCKSFIGSVVLVTSLVAFVCFMRWQLVCRVNTGVYVWQGQPESLVLMLKSYTMR